MTNITAAARIHLPGITVDVAGTLGEVQSTLDAGRGGFVKFTALTGERPVAVVVSQVIMVAALSRDEIEMLAPSAP